MKKGQRILLVSLLSLTAIAAILLFNFYLKEQKLLFYATGSKHKAFLNATWEMSEVEVERANNTELDKAEFDLFFLPDTRYPKVLKMSRYKSRIQTDITVWGQKARVEYAFFDDKLFEYTLFLEGFDADKLHHQILRNISHKYGDGNKQNSEKYLHSMFWNTDSIDISYWLLEKESKNTYISKSFLAGIRVDYKSMFKKIENISKNEHQSLF